MRLWPEGPICPHCGTIDKATLMQGKTTRSGLYQCNSCREPFTVTVNALYERSKIPLHKWLAATHLMMASKKGMSALQIGRLLGLSKKTSWFLCHRIIANQEFRSIYFQLVRLGALSFLLIAAYRRPMFRANLHSRTYRALKPLPSGRNSTSAMLLGAFAEIRH